MTNETVTQAQIDAFNAKWEANPRTQSAFELRVPNDTEIEYAKKVEAIRKGEKEKYSLDDAKKYFYERLKTMIGTEYVSSKKISETIKEDNDYQTAMRYLVELVFGFESENLKGKGGIILCSLPGVGKSTLLRTAYICSVVVNRQFLNPSIVQYASMVRDIGSKLKGNNDIDLTYQNKGHLFLDEITEKINQVSHYGDYKYSLNEVFQNRYDLWKSCGHYTVMATNLFPGEGENTLNSYLDNRSMDRIREQYLIIEMLGKSKRK